MSDMPTGEMMRAALAVLTYPPDADQDGLMALINDWKPEDYADYLATTQVIFEILGEEFGAERLAAVVDRLRRQSLTQD